MRDLAPDITRKRLIIEGFFSIDVTKKTIEEFFEQLCAHLVLRKYGKPIIFSPSGEGKAENQGYDAFIPLIDSGISLYIWSNKKFFSCILFTCKDFDEKKAITYTQTFFKAKEMEYKLF